VGVDTPKLDAEVLVAGAMGIDRLDLVANPDLELTPEASRTAMEWIRRRTRREPVAYITERKWFRNLELHVDRRVLIPRPQTELLVEVVLGMAAEGSHVHDVGTGCGAIALALKDERPDLRVSASDASLDALAVARANAERLGLDVEFSETLMDADLTVGNLPYVLDEEWAGLEPEITEYEPRMAFLGGGDGLDIIRGFLADVPGRRVALEHAYDQGAAVRELLTDAETYEFVTIGRAR
jgi:release factor glutamine methyltransferase